MRFLDEWKRTKNAWCCWCSLSGGQEGGWLLMSDSNKTKVKFLPCREIQKAFTKMILTILMGDILHPKDG